MAALQIRKVVERERKIKKVADGKPGMMRTDKDFRVIRILFINVKSKNRRTYMTEEKRMLWIFLHIVEKKILVGLETS